MPDPAAPSRSAAHDQDTSAIGTLQSLIVAFVLAMTFRGFVVEGFVIPTGSMAPTLLGAHALVHSNQTSITYPVGVAAEGEASIDVGRLSDPMLGPQYANPPGLEAQLRRRMGDRILVLKCLYPFFQPQRFDVVVFKNPTSPVGGESNYIKRLIGLPNEQVWLVDGDVFARAEGAVGGGEFKIQRKPEHVQRAVWQMVHHSDYVPIDPARLDERYGRKFVVSPWVGVPKGGGAAEGWDTSGRAYRCTSAAPSVLRWDAERRRITDWTPYNSLTPPHLQPELEPVSDIRVSAGVVADQVGLSMLLELEARGHIFEYDLRDGQAVMRMRRIESSQVIAETKLVAIDIGAASTAGRVFNVEFWHVDQALRLFIDGKEALPPLEYDYSPLERLQSVTGNWGTDDVDILLERRPAELPAAQVRWHFEGAPVTLHRVRVDRDLHYRRRPLNYDDQKNTPRMSGPAFGTHPAQNKAVLGPDHFMMCGDNSQASLDSRLWGSPHELVATQIDDAPFVVNRKLLLGKAWVVYFPSPHAVSESPRAVAVIPDFGRLRFIR